MAGSNGDREFCVVSYDVPSDKRRNRVHRVLTGFGEWVQYSVFECHLTKKELLMMRSKLDRVLNPEEDRVRIYHMCSACVAKVESIGCEGPRERDVYVV